MYQSAKLPSADDQEPTLIREAPTPHDCPRLLANRPAVGYTWNMKLSVTLDRDEDGIWVAECPSIPGCVSQGKTKLEALKNIKEAIALCLEVRAERGLPLTIETQQVEVAV